MRFGEDADGERVSILIDFVEPTLFRVRDLPGAIREQCHQCAGKMTYLFRSGDETLDYVRDANRNSSSWREYHRHHHVDCEEYKLLKEKLTALYTSDNAMHLRSSHGQRHHDIATIVGTKRSVPMTWKEGGGTGYGFGTGEVDLGDEIAILDEQRVCSQEAYTALNEYLGRLFDAHIDDLQKRSYAPLEAGESAQERS